MMSPSTREARLPHRAVWRPLRSTPGSNEGLYVAGLRSTIHRDEGSDLPDAVVLIAYHSRVGSSTNRIRNSASMLTAINHLICSFAI